jgi:DNA-binding NarL/FixJ family response regulator
VCSSDLKGGMYLSPLLSSVLTSLALEEDKTEILTMREREVIKLIAEGKRTKDIAEALFISPYTVRRHRANIMEKLNLNSLADLVKYAISQTYIVDQS